MMIDQTRFGQFCLIRSDEMKSDGSVESQSAY